jgi:hypothetical protein
MATDRKTPIEKLEKLREEGIKDSSILDYLVKNWLSADDANDAMDALLDEYELNDEDDKDDEENNIYIDHEG